MKKTESSKKLKLKRETVRTLTSEQLEQVAGGTEITPSEVVPRLCHGHPGPNPQ
jgi:hypothetical protein